MMGRRKGKKRQGWVRGGEGGGGKVGTEIKSEAREVRARAGGSATGPRKTESPQVPLSLPCHLQQILAEAQPRQEGKGREPGVVGGRLDMEDPFHKEITV